MVFDGDSLTSSYPNTVVANLYPLGNVELLNVSASGKTLVQMVANHSNIPAWAPYFQKSAVALWGGTNDLGAGDTAANAWANIQQHCQSSKAKGYQTVVLTVTARDDASWSEGKEAQRQALNALIVGGDANIDSVVDVASEANLLDPSNATYFNADKLHLVTAGYNIVAADVQAAISAL